MIISRKKMITLLFGVFVFIVMMFVQLGFNLHKAEAESQTVEIKESTTGAPTGIFITSDSPVSGISCIIHEGGYWDLP